MSAPGIPDVAATGHRALDEVETVIVGKRPALEQVLIGLLADGHVILEDLPGLAKTLTARLLAGVLGLRLSRIQFTPDLLPADVTGSAVFDQRTTAFEFRPGPVFTNLLLGDEINRAPPKTQSALLEAMQERQVTVDGVSHRLPIPFNVLATQNPIEYEGTYPLPEAQLDRFLLRVRLGYPTAADEEEILRRRLDRSNDEPAVTAVATADDLPLLRAAVEQVHVADPVVAYIVRVVEATRTHPGLLTGASPRASLALLAVTRARAALDGRAFVRPDDVKALAGPALAHRLVVKPEMWARGLTGDRAVDQCLEQVPTPHAEDVLGPP